MIISRTPFRISFAGGGTDLAAFYEQQAGAVLSTAIDKYMYISVMNRFGQGFRISYSRTEITDDVAGIEHPIVREALRELGITRGLEVVSMADLPAESGMGSSSSFTVGLFHALQAFTGRVVSPEDLAAQACRLEIERLGEPIGKQDQYIAAYGGMQFIQFHPDGRVQVDPVICPKAARQELGRRLLLFYTGKTRAAREILHRQKANTGDRMAVLAKMRDLAHTLRVVLTSGRSLSDFGAILHEGWELKKTVDASISSGVIDEYYEKARQAGALGGKILGAGGGGFLLFYCEPHWQDRVREALADLLEMPFQLEAEGSKIVHVSGNRW
jgi:D-glycero-alpha-D-manno-heptose-7-phosphate kinase